jgi:hypothetical protein
MKAIVARFALPTLEHKDAPLPWQRLGLQFTRSGYGGKIPSRLMVKLPGSKRWRRVYIACYSNAGTYYVPDSDGNWTVIY